MVKESKKLLRVTLISFYFNSAKYSGANKRFIRILEELSRKDNIETTVIVGKDAVSRELKQKLTSSLYWLEWPYNGSLTTRLICFLRLFIYRLFHRGIIISDYFPPLPFFNDFYYLVHDIRIGTKVNRKNYRFIREYIQKYLMKFARNILTVSESSKSEVTNFLGRNTNIFVVENGLSDMYYSANRVSVLRDIDLLYVADADIRKNHRYIEKLLANIDKPLKVYLVGVDKSEINFKAGPHTIVLRKDLIEEELVSIYSRTKVYICPSNLEGFNMPILEALALRCNVLCSDLRVHREIFGSQANVEFLTGRLDEDKEMLLSLLVKENVHIDFNFLGYYRWANRVNELVRIISLK